MSDHNSTPSNTLTAFYEDREMAERAVQRLVDAGIGRDSVRLVEGDDAVSPEARSSDDNKGFWESLGDFFLPSAEREVYSEGLRRGGYLVTVTGVAAELSDIALDILDDEGSVDIDERAASWRSEGWSPPAIEDLAPAEYDRTGDPKISGMAGVASASGNETPDDVDEAIPDLKEDKDLRVGKRDMTSGRVRARSYSVDKSRD
ncbi:hypothetical protein [Phyllobacterium zundukense]|nr:hypothetical protein [Phyllobacterium zundukense]